MAKKKFYYAFATIIILILISLVYLGLFTQKPWSDPQNNQNITRPAQIRPITEYYEVPCPDLDMYSMKGQRIRLIDFLGDVTVIRFSSFHPQDIPYLVYLDHLGNNLTNNGLHLLFIKVLRKGEIRQNISLDSLSSPIIEDDGYLAGLFNANLNDLIIIGRDFKIKLKYNRASNAAIYRQIIRWLFEDKQKYRPIQDEERGELIKKIVYRDVETGSLVSLRKKIRGKRAYVNLLIAPCYTCPELYRFSILKEVSKNLSQKSTEIIALFSKGNSEKSIKKIGEANGLFEHMSLGIIDDAKVAPNYYDIYKYEIDPYLVVYNKKGNIILSENTHTTRKINEKYLMEIK